MKTSAPGLCASPRKGFTLIELLVVIAIIAILAVVVVLTLNPAELLRQSRDANRLSDLATLQSAVNLYVTDQGGSPGFSLGLSSTTYLSIPDPNATSTAGTDCSDMSTNFAAGGYFACPASSTYHSTNDTGWIPIDFSSISEGSPFGSLPVDPVNTTSSNLYYSYQTNGTTFRLAAMPESQKYLASDVQDPTMFVAGSNTTLDGGTWVPVPGNSQFGTSNFYVMKYEAACASISTGAAQTTPVSAYNTYQDNHSAASNCKFVNGLAPTSLPNAIPISYVTQASAASYCAAIGAHLITNDEWQTIAWNAEGVASNWSGGSVGSGAVYSGHNNDAPATALVASSDDTQGYYGETVTSTSQIRTLTLSNGSIVWDLAGNLWEWTNDTITGSNEPNAGSGSFAWRQFTTITNWGTMTQQTAGPSNNTWTTTQGMGEIYSEGSSTDSATYVLRRGGNWDNTSQAGIEALQLNSLVGSSLDYIGFRCAR